MANPATKTTDIHATYIPITHIRLSPKQLRKLSTDKVHRYARDYESGHTLPPVTLVNCGSFYTIRDGRHRYVAQLRNGYTTIPAIII